ncbi:MAG: CRISPR-associated endonuclease Cas6 [Bacillota bacterium]
MEQVKKAILEFNLNQDLPLSFGHKLRGFFANRFEDVLFHHHRENGELRYGYPLIQYKIIEGNPTVIGLNRGAELISDKFLAVEELSLAGEDYLPVEKKLNVVDHQLEVVDDLEFGYQFYSPWLGLNQQNYHRYLSEIKGAGQSKEENFLGNILIGNFLTLAKGVDWWVEEEIRVDVDLSPVDVRFKNQEMIGFTGRFTSNIKLPQYIGLGKSTARGFGVVKCS